MNGIIETFGKIVGKEAKNNPMRARKILLAGYRARQCRLTLFPKRIPSPAKNYEERVIMASIIKALSHPTQSAMVSLFVPCEPLAAAGIYPYSVEVLSAFMTGSKCQQAFLEHASEEGVPETLCSYHRVFLGGAGLGIMPKPKMVIYTNIACDANMITFPYLGKNYKVPGFALDVPYEISEDSVIYVADQLRQMTGFIENYAGKKITETALRAAVKRSKSTVENYLAYLNYQKERCLNTDLTSEMYAVFMTHVLLGTGEAEKFSRMCLEEIKKAPNSKGIRLLWLHVIPFWQEAVRKRLNYNNKAYIATCDVVYESLIPMDENQPYRSMARRLVYSAFNGGAEHRIAGALAMAEKVGADGAVCFCHWGCKGTLGAAQLIKSALEANGLPTLILDGDGCDPQNSSNEQVGTRLDAFIEMLEGTCADDKLHM